MKREIDALDFVALTEDIPAHGLLRGPVGTVVESLGPGVFEVEFVDNDGRTYATLPLKSSQLLVLHYQLAQSNHLCGAGLFSSFLLPFIHAL